MTVHDAFRRCLIELDVIGICDLWYKVAPDMPQPRNNEEALVGLHIARTKADSIPANLRYYSHSWLMERSLPSGLPDDMKPIADRLYPRIVEAVGISVDALSERDKPLAKAIEKAMSDAVAECYANGDRDPELIKARMAEARRNVLR